MYRVCRPGGRVVILNHFKSANALMGKIETAISPVTVHIGFTADLVTGVWVGFDQPKTILPNGFAAASGFPSPFE